MRELFEKIRDNGEAAILSLLSDRVEEDLQLDFKRKKSPERPGFSDDDKRALGEALSGFSNSAGGLLIFGVDCRKGSDLIDCVQGFEPICHISQLASDARGLVSSYLQPANEGVEVLATECGDRPGWGYLSVWIPRSDRRPHQSRAPGHNKYFKRNSQSFLPMEHYDVEDAFSRKGAAVLEIRTQIVSDWVHGDDVRYIIKIFLRNVSNLIAKFPYIVFEKLDGAVLPIVDQPLKLERGVRHQAVMGGADDVIHPETERLMAYVSVGLKRNAEGSWMFKSSADGRILTIDLTYGCEDGRAMRYGSSTSPIAFGPYL